MVCGTEDIVAQGAEGEDEGVLPPREVHRVAGQVLRLESVEGWEEGGIAPREHEAEVIVGDVDGASVPLFVVEEVEDVEGLQGEEDDG